MFAACSGVNPRASESPTKTAINCSRIPTPAEVARVRQLDSPERQAYMAACGYYDYGCGSSSSQVLDPRTGKPTGAMVTAAPPVCDYTRVFRGQHSPAKLVKIAGHCYLRAPRMPDIPVPCVPHSSQL